jgi:hypothetical protein
VFPVASGAPVHCGAQADDFVVWLEIGPDLRVRRTQSVLTGSCYTDVDADVTVKDGRLEIRNGSRTTTYDSRDPTTGLVEPRNP